MGQVLRRLQELDHLQTEEDQKPDNCCARLEKSKAIAKTFPDLQNLPPELGLAVLSHLNATDLCLAACVWDGLANDELLWMGFV